MNAQGEQLCMPVWCKTCGEEHRKVRYTMVICDERLSGGAPDARAVELAKAGADEDGSECGDETGERDGVL